MFFLKANVGPFVTALNFCFFVLVFFLFCLLYEWIISEFGIKGMEYWN